MFFCARKSPPHLAERRLGSARLGGDFLAQNFPSSRCDRVWFRCARYFLQKRSCRNFVVRAAKRRAARAACGARFISTSAVAPLILSSILFIFQSFVPTGVTDHSYWLRIWPVCLQLFRAMGLLVARPAR